MASNRPRTSATTAAEVASPRGDGARTGCRPHRTADRLMARREGLAGATVIRGIEGFGADSHLHTSRILRLSEDLPVVIEIVDTEENVDRVLPMLDPMVTEGMLTVEKVHVIAYRSSKDQTS